MATAAKIAATQSIVTRSRAVAIIQARMGSSRLPGKVLLEIEGQPMLVHVVERARRAKSLGGVIVATTTDAQDDPIAEECQRRGYDVYRGSLNDVLDRYYQAVKAADLRASADKVGKLHAANAADDFRNADVIIRLTGDCPLLEPDLIDRAVEAVETGLFDFACTRLPPPWHRTFPIGLDVEVCTFNALERAWKRAEQAYQREHVMPYIYEECRSQHYGITLGRNLDKEHVIVGELKKLPTAPASEPSPFKVLIFDHQPDYGDHRWTVDTPEDLEAVRKIYGRFPGRSDFHWYEVIDLIEGEPELAYYNTDGKAKDYRQTG